MDKYKKLVERLRNDSSECEIFSMVKWGTDFNLAADAIEELLKASEKPTGLLPVGTDLDDIVDLGEYFFSINSNMEEKVNDLISRQAAIDEIDEWIKAFRENVHKESAADARFIRDGIIQLPSSQPERLTDDDFETIRIHLNAYKEQLGNQHRWKEAEEYQRIIDRFMAFASAQPEQIARDIATIIENEQDMRVILKNAEHTETHSCDYQRTETHDLISRQAAIDANTRAVER